MPVSPWMRLLFSRGKDIVMRVMNLCHTLNRCSVSSLIWQHWCWRCAHRKCGSDRSGSVLANPNPNPHPYPRTCSGNEQVCFLTPFPPFATLTNALVTICGYCGTQWTIYGCKQPSSSLQASVAPAVASAIQDFRERNWVMLIGLSQISMGEDVIQIGDHYL